MKGVASLMPVVFATLVCACSVNGTMFETERPLDAEYVLKEYGAAPAAIVPIEINGTAYDFNVQLGLHPRVRVQASQPAADATADLASKISMGAIVRKPNDAPYREAAIKHLGSAGKSECVLKSGGLIRPSVFEWSYQCAKS